MTHLDFLFDGLDVSEQSAPLRVLHALVALYCGGITRPKLALDAVVFDNVPPTEALALVAKLPTLIRRRLF